MAIRLTSFLRRSRLQATIAPKQKGEAVEADSPVLLQQLSKARAHQLTSAFQDREQAGAALRKALATLVGSVDVCFEPSCGY